MKIFGRLDRLVARDRNRDGQVGDARIEHQRPVGPREIRTRQRRAVHRGEAQRPHAAAARQPHHVQRHAARTLQHRHRAHRQLHHAVIAVQPRDMPDRQAVHRREISAHHDMPIDLRHHAEHGGVSAHADIKRRVQRTRRIHPRQPVARDAVVAGEIPADTQTPGRIQRERAHRAVGAGPARVGEVHRAIHIQPRQVGPRGTVHARETAADDHAVIRLHRHRVNLAARARVGIVGDIQRTIGGIQARQPGPREPVEVVEQTADQHLAIRLHAQRVHDPVRAAAHARPRVARAVRVQTGEPRPRRAVHRREVTTDQHLAAAQNQNGNHRPVQHRRERRVQRAVGREPREERLRGAIDPREAATHQHAAIRLHRERVADVVQAQPDAERKIERTVGPQPRQAVDVRAVDRREIPRDDDLPIALHRHGGHRAVGPDAGGKVRIHAAHAVIVHDAHRRHRRHPEHRTARRGAERDGESFVRLRQQILRDRDRDREISHTRQEGEVDGHRRVILAGNRRNIRRRDRHAHAHVGRSGARHRHPQRAGIFADTVNCGAQLEGHVVVQDRQDRGRDPAQHRTAGRIGEEQEHRLVAFRQRVHRDRDVHRLQHRVRREIHHRVHRRVIQPRRRRSVRGGHRRTHRGRENSRAPNRDSHHARRLAHRVRHRRELDRRVVINDRERRRGLRAQRRQCVSTRQAQRQIHRLVSFHQGVLKNRDAERLVRLAGAEHQRAGLRHVIRTRRGRTVARAVIHAHRAVGVAGAQHADDRVGTALLHDVVRRGKLERDVVVDDRQHRVGLAADEAHADQAAEIQQHGLRGLHQAVVQNPHRKRLRRHADGKRQHAVGRHEILPGRGRAGDRGEVHRHRVVRRPQARHRDQRVGRRLGHGVGRRGELHHAVVVDDRDDGVGDARRRAPAEVEQLHREGFVALGDRVIDHPHGEGLGRHSRPKGQRAIRRGVIRRSRRGARHGAETNRHRTRGTVGANDGDDRVGRALVYGERRAGKPDLPRPEIIVDDRQHRRRRSRERRRAGRVQQRQIDRLVPLHREVVIDHHRHRLRRDARPEDQRVGQPDVIHAHRRRAAADRRKIHRARAQQAAGAHHRDERAARAFAHRIRRHAERKHAVVVQHRQHRSAQRPNARAHRIRQQQVHRPRRIRHRIVNQRHCECLDRLARLERERAKRVAVIDPRDRRQAVGRRVIHRHHPGRAAEPHHGDERRAGILRHGERRRRKLQRARTRAERPAVEPHDPAAIDPVELAEPAHRDDLRVPRLQRDRADEVVRAAAERDAQIQAAIGIHPRDAVLHHAAVRRERAADQQLPVRLQRQTEHRIIRADRRVEVHIHDPEGAEHRHMRARLPGDIQELAARKHLAVGPHGEGVDRAVKADSRIKRDIHRTRRRQARETVPHESVDRREIATDQHLAIRLHGERLHAVVGADAHVERGVQRAVGVQPRHQRGGRAVEQGEITDDEHLAIRLQRDGIDLGVRAGADGEGRIDEAIEVQPHEVIARHAVDVGEEARREHPAVRLHDDADNRTVGHAAREPEEIIIEGTVGVQPRDAAAVGAVVLREVTRDDHFADVRRQRRIRVERDREHRGIRAGQADERAIHAACGRAGDFVIGQIQHRVAERAQLRTRRSGRSAQIQQHRAGGIGHRVVEDQYIEGLVGIADAEGQHAVRAAIIQAVDGGAVGGRERNSVDDVGHARPQNGDRQEAAILRDAVNAGAELEINVVVEDRHRGVAEAQAGGPGRHARGIGQHEGDQPVIVHHRIVDHRHEHVREGLAGREIEDRIHRPVMHAARRREVLRQQFDTRDIKQRALPQHGHRDGQPGFAHRVIGRAETEHAVVVLNRQRRVGQPEQQPARVRAQREQNRAVGIGNEVVDDADRERLRRRIAIGPEERAVGAEIMDEVGGRAVRRPEGCGHRAATAVGADDRDGRQRG